MNAPQENNPQSTKRFRFAIVFAILVVVDIATKLITYYAIAAGPANFDAPIAYSVMINDTGSNAALDHYEIGSDLNIVLFGILFVLMAVYVVAIQKATIPLMMKIAVGVVAYFVLSMLISLLQDVHGFFVQSKYLLG
jgi:hypothetical protein